MLDYPYFRENYKLIAIDLSKQKALDTNIKGMQQINFTGNLERAVNKTTFFITEEVTKTILGFLQGNVTVL